MCLLCSTHTYNNKLIIEEVEKLFKISSFSLKEFINVHKEINVVHSVKTPCIANTSQNKISFRNNILYYTVNISLKIEYIEDNSLLLFPIDFFYSSYITLQNKSETIHLNPKINKFILEKLEEENLYVYISFFPY